MTHLTPDDRTQVLNALKRNLNGRPGWDLPPEWGAVHRGANGRMRCHPFPIPASHWNRAGHPNNVLAAYRDFLAHPRGANQRALAAQIRDSVPPTMVALYLSHEGWAPPAHRVQAIYAMDKRPAFKDLPDRVEVRVAGAVDLDSSLYMATQPRPTMALDGTVDDMTTGSEVSGEQPELLLALLHLLIKSPQEARP